MERAGIDRRRDLGCSEPPPGLATQNPIGPARARTRWSRQRTGSRFPRRSATPGADRDPPRPATRGAEPLADLKPICTLDEWAGVIEWYARSTSPAVAQYAVALARASARRPSSRLREPSGLDQLCIGAGTRTLYGATTRHRSTSSHGGPSLSTASSPRSRARATRSGRRPGERGPHRDRDAGHRRAPPPLRIVPPPHRAARPGLCRRRHVSRLDRVAHNSGSGWVQTLGAHLRLLPGRPRRAGFASARARVAVAWSRPM